MTLHVEFYLIRFESLSIEPHSIFVCCAKCAWKPMTPSKEALPEAGTWIVMLETLRIPSLPGPSCLGICPQHPLPSFLGFSFQPSVPLLSGILPQPPSPLCLGFHSAPNPVAHRVWDSDPRIWDSTLIDFCVRESDPCLWDCVRLLWPLCPVFSPTSLGFPPPPASCLRFRPLFLGFWSAPMVPPV